MEKRLVDEKTDSDARRSRMGTGALLMIGFGFALCFFILLLFYGLRQLDAIHGNLREILDTNNIKTSLISEMRNAARERTLNLFTMIGMDDAFQRDEVYLEFNKNGARFARARIALLDMSLSKAEQEILARQAGLTAKAVPLQNRVVSLLEQEDMGGAQALLYQDALVAQNDVLAALVKLTDLQFEANEAVSVLADQEHERGNGLMLLLGGMSSLIGITIAIVVTRRILATEQSLFQEKELAEVTLGSIADGVITLDQNDRVSYMNTRAQTMLNVAAGSSTGRPVDDVLVFDNKDCARLGMGALACIGQRKQGHVQGLHEPLQLAGPGQASLWVEASVSNMRLAARNHSGKAVVIHDVSQEFEAKQALHELNAELEARVDERTRELGQANEELHATIARLKDTQNQLIQSEKMASLGSLVAGISHEINTPIGIGVTSASNIHEELARLNKHFEAGELKRAELSQFIGHASQAADILLHNLQRASDLIRSFKQVAVDQSSDDWREVDLRQYCDEIFTSLHPKLKRRRLTVHNQCDEGVRLYTNPGAIYQVVSNLVLNSLNHAFKDDVEGNITISAVTDGDEVLMDYRDDGVGIEEENLGRIFDPFFTTRRGQGGSGLGLNIVYNLVTSTLNGKISVENCGQGGACFAIRFPSQAVGEIH